MNIARTTVKALTAMLENTQSLHTNAMNKMLTLPTNRTTQITLQTQQILTYKTEITNTIDPLGGSYFVEDLTRRMEEEAESYFERIEGYGEIIAAIEAKFMQKKITDATFQHQQKLEQRQ